MLKRDAEIRWDALLLLPDALIPFNERHAGPPCVAPLGLESSLGAPEPNNTSHICAAGASQFCTL